MTDEDYPTVEDSYEIRLECRACRDGTTCHMFTFPGEPDSRWCPLYVPDAPKWSVEVF